MLHTKFQGHQSIDSGWMDEWMTCDFTSFLTAFQSYQNDVRMIMKGCVQWNFTAEKISPQVRIELGPLDQ